MLLLRIIGGWFLIVAVVALVYDGTKTLGGDGGIVMTPLGQHWFNLHAPSLNLSQAIIERYVAPWLWDPVILSVLEAPTWLVFSILGLIFLYLGRRRKKIDLYAN